MTTYRSVLCLCLCLFLIILILLFVYKNIECMSNNDSEDIQLVIARYNEKLKWLDDDLFRNVPSICYNSGIDKDFHTPENMNVVNIENIGKEAYVYIYHIVKNYDNLAEITVFLPGSTDEPSRHDQVKKLMLELKTNKKTIFYSNNHDDIKKDLYNFSLDTWCSTNSENIKLNSKCNLTLSEIRPFGKWYESTFGDIKTTRVNYRGVFAIEKKYIIQRPRSFYEKLLAQFKTPNDEVAHYFERAWEAVFYPMEDGIFNM